MERVYERSELHTAGCLGADTDALTYVQNQIANQIENNNSSSFLDYIGQKTNTAYKIVIC